VTFHSCALFDWFNEFCHRLKNLS